MCGKLVVDAVGPITIGDLLTVDLVADNAHAATDGEETHALALSTAADGEVVAIDVFDFHGLICQQWPVDMRGCIHLEQRRGIA